MVFMRSEPEGHDPCEIHAAIQGNRKECLRSLAKEISSDAVLPQLRRGRLDPHVDLRFVEQCPCECDP
ncbi:hypothetical protein T265_01279 [Opisthorchis viverrini]|uniref:Uncharacterized protein n=1 Tax=Opisthorchis viverrini TaxID=6198 RepID=A0A075A3H0_OPIVI|nr:hypothetical protein T265_01279 [Opisthorchis viverrini]KER32807.1 hypothetical protein T265_01279 [Opisthorchis viverrini]